MQAVIMAGGKGTRLTPVTKDFIPKPMVDICGKPLLEWQIEILKQYGILDVCIVVGHLGDKIKDFFKDGRNFGIKVSYVEEKEPLGTAGALYYLKDWICKAAFFLIFGDVFFDIDLNRMMQFHVKNQSEATMLVHPNSHPYDSDLICMDDTGKVIKFDSKHNTRNYWYDNCVNAGLYILNPAVCNMIKQPVKKDLEKDILQEFIIAGKKIYGYRTTEYIKDIGTAERIAATIDDVKNGFTKMRCLNNKQKCIFLDRDGTINKLKGLLYDIDEFELEDSVIEAIREINHSEWICIVVTNQPVVARGLCSINDVESIHKKMSTLLGNAGVYLDDILYCPHHPHKGYPEENPVYKISCKCRKPNTGMIELCAKKYNIDLSESWMIGDTTTDIQTGINAGMHTALVKTGLAGSDDKYDVKAELSGSTLYDIVETIIKDKKYG